MKVLLIGASDKYGAPKSLYYLCKYLKTQEVDVEVVLSGDNGWKTRFESEGIGVHIIPFGFDTYDPGQKICKRILLYIAKKILNTVAEIKIGRLLSANKYDILHINSAVISCGFKAAGKRGIKTVWHIREFVQEDFAREFYNAKKAYRRIGSADKIIAISDAVYTKYKKILHNDQIEIIYNGIDVSQINTSSRPILQEDITKIAFVGRMSKEKGPYDVLEAIGLLSDLHNSISVEFAGDGVELENLKRIVCEKGWESFVSFKGYCDDIPKFFADKDICVIASQREAFGRVTVEAMLSGVLVIGANTGGTAEIIADNRGLLYEQGNEKDLAMQIRYAISNREIARENAQRGQRYALENYTAERNAINIYRVYNEILGEDRCENGVSI